MCSVRTSDSKACLQRGQPGPHAAVINIAAHLMRNPPISAGFWANEVFSPGPYSRAQSSLDAGLQYPAGNGVALSTLAVRRCRSSFTSR